MTATKPQVLCVDDMPANLALLHHLLTPVGYEVIKALDGQIALKIIRERPIDLVILDVIMPGITGYEVCRTIKEDIILRNIPVIIMTTLTEPDDRINGIEAGADDFISKPFNRMELLARTNRLLRIRELNRNLHYAYEKITTLTSHGENLMRNFNPTNFEFMANIDGIVDLIIRHGFEDRRPGIVLVGLMTPDGWEAYKYVADKSPKAHRTPFDSEKYRHMVEDLNGNSTTTFCNEEDDKKPEVEFFIEQLRTANDQPIAVKNMVYYLSECLCLFAINHDSEVSKYDAEILKNLVIESLFFKSLAAQVRETEHAFEYVVYALARAAEKNDEDTGNHIIRVGEYSALLASKLKMPSSFVDEIRIKATLHDVGKIHTKPAILKKAGKLTAKEWGIMKAHPIHGSEIIGDHPRLRMAQRIALTHHERYDGSGYPNNLRGEGIPIEGRIVSVADQYDALRNSRPYKPSMDHETACKVILQGDGKTMPHHFDPQVIKAFSETTSKFADMYK